MNQDSIVTINLRQQKKLIQSTSSKKYQVIILLMLDCGLRVTEVVKLQCKHISFSQNQITPKFQKKERTIPVTQQLLKSLADYWQILLNSNPEDYLFPAG